MVANFNADEVFAMAEQIERNGAKFYATAAGNATVQKTKDFLTGLARMEKDHEEVFSSMRAELKGRGKEETVPDPDGVADKYLSAMAGGHVFDTKVDPSSLLSGKEPLADILKTAIELEKDSIVYYLGLKEVVPQHLGGDKIDLIIREEMGHIATLGAKLAAAL